MLEHEGQEVRGVLKELEQADRFGLVVNVGLCVGATIAVNALIFSLGWNNQPAGVTRAPFAPPDFIVASVWVALVALLATARWWLNASNDAAVTNAKGWVTLLFVSCLTWPLYSLATGSVFGGFLGCVLTVGIGVWTLRQILRFADWKPSLAAPATLMVAPVIVWVAFATLIVARELRWL
jgi:tryptophan-rich sensory protein